MKRRRIRRWFSARQENARQATLELQAQMRRLRIYRSLQGVMVASLVLAAVAGVVQLRRFLLTTEHLALRVIDVTGTTHATEWEVKTLGGLKPGLNLLSLELDRIAAEIERHPWVEEVWLRRTFPDRLSVTVQERVPVAILVMDDLFYVDGEGTIFKKVKPGERLDFPVLTGFEVDARLRRARIGQQAIRECLELLEAIGTHTKFAPEQVSELHIDPDRGYSVFTAEAATQIHLGWAHFDTKLERLVKLLEGQRLDLPQVRRIDLDLSRWAVVTPL